MSTAAGLRRQAAEHYGHASGALARGRADAKLAADFYRMAAAERRQAAWLTSRPDLTYGQDALIPETPADAEQSARACTRTADKMLAASFKAEANCQFYKELGDRYTAMARNQESRGELVLF